MVAIRWAKRAAGEGKQAIADQVGAVGQHSISAWKQLHQFEHNTCASHASALHTTRFTGCALSEPYSKSVSHMAHCERLTNAEAERENERDNCTHTIAHTHSAREHLQKRPKATVVVTVRRNVQQSR